MQLEVTLVAGSRPDLLRRTLDSFSERLFCNFLVHRVVANIDPIFGSEADKEQCKDIINQFFPNSLIFTPDKPSFGAAVKRVWSQTTGQLVFHLEDDWLLLEPIKPEMIVELAKNYAAIKPVAAEHHWKGDDPTRYEKPFLKLFGIGLIRRRLPLYFGTSPGFHCGKFVRQFAALLNPDMDPEKQIKTKYNSAIAIYCKKHTYVYLPGVNQRELIKDIGR